MTPGSISTFAASSGVVARFRRVRGVFVVAVFSPLAVLRVWVDGFRGLSAEAGLSVEARFCVCAAALRGCGGLIGAAAAS